MTKQKRRSKRGNTTILGDFPLRSLHMRRMREIIVHAYPFSPFPAHPLSKPWIFIYILPLEQYNP